MLVASLPLASNACVSLKDLAYLSPFLSDFYPFKADIIDLEAEARPSESVIVTTDIIAVNILNYLS